MQNLVLPFSREGNFSREYRPFRVRHAALFVIVTQFLNFLCRQLHASLPPASCVSVDAVISVNCYFLMNHEDAWHRIDIFHPSVSLRCSPSETRDPFSSFLAVPRDFVAILPPAFRRRSIARLIVLSLDAICSVHFRFARRRMNGNYRHGNPFVGITERELRN